MRRLLKLLVFGAVMSIGVELGRKLWNEFIVGKIDSFKTQFVKKD